MRVAKLTLHFVRSCFLCSKTSLVQHFSWCSELFFVSSAVVMVRVPILWPLYLSSSMHWARWLPGVSGLYGKIPWRRFAEACVRTVRYCCSTDGFFYSTSFLYFFLQVCWKNYHLQKQPRACSQVGLATVSLVLFKETGHLHQISRIWTCAAIIREWLFFILKGDLQLISLLRLFCHCAICLSPCWRSNAAPPGNILHCWWATNLPGNCKILFFQGKAET